MTILALALANDAPTECPDCGQPAYQVVNWGIFQHYRNRRPPWIKLHRTLLEDFRFVSLSDASAALAPRLWLLASESNDGTFTSNLDELAFRLYRSRDRVATTLEEMVRAGFLVQVQVDASGVLAPCLHRATPETETERETEKREKRPRATKGRRTFKAPSPREVQAHLDELGERRFNGVRFCSYYESRGWTVGKDHPMVDWKGAVRTWQHNEDVRQAQTPGLDDERLAAAQALDDAPALDAEAS